MGLSAGVVEHRNKPMDKENVERIDCFKCKHFAVSWNPSFPRACKLFGFKTAQMPSVAVLTSSGEPCEGFERKETGRE